MRRAGCPAWVDGARHGLSADVATELRLARRRRGWSVRTAAELLGISTGHVSMLERGQRCPSVAVAHVLIDGLRLDDELASRLLEQARPDAGRSSPYR